MKNVWNFLQDSWRTETKWFYSLIRCSGDFTEELFDWPRNREKHFLPTKNANNLKRVHVCRECFIEILDISPDRVSLFCHKFLKKAKSGDRIYSKYKHNRLVVISSLQSIQSYYYHTRNILRPWIIHWKIEE